MLSMLFKRKAPFLSIEFKDSLKNQAAEAVNRHAQSPHSM
jgi:hypothetical protein